MKNENKNIQENRQETKLRGHGPAIPLEILAYMKVYARATGAFISIHDKNFMAIPEQPMEMYREKNICNFCIKYSECKGSKDIDGIELDPCRDMHINALRESHRYGGSYIYGCSLGIMFWTSPIFLNRQFSGAVMGSGIPAGNREEICERMHKMCGGAESKAAIQEMLSQYPHGEPGKIKAMASLMLLCAKSLSTGSGDRYESMKRRAMQQMDLSAKIYDLKMKYPPGSTKPPYPMSKERKLLMAYHSGDIEQGRQILNEILALLFFSYPDQYRHIQCRAIELAVLLSRMETGSGFPSGAILETNSRYIKLIEEAGNIEELIDIMSRIADNLADAIASFRDVNHASALKKAERFIMANYSRKISLEEIARDSGFSAPYFSTIFKEEMGENLSSYLNRLRVARAGYMLKETNYPLSKIARACGFEDQSWFSKIFKTYAGISPGKYRSQGGKRNFGIPPTTFSGGYQKLINEEETHGDHQ